MNTRVFIMLNHSLKLKFFHLIVYLKKTLTLSYHWSLSIPTEKVRKTEALMYSWGVESDQQHGMFNNNFPSCVSNLQKQPFTDVLWKLRSSHRGVL